MLNSKMTVRNQNNRLICLIFTCGSAVRQSTLAQPFEIICVCAAGHLKGEQPKMAPRKKSSIVGAVADSVTDAVSSAIDALAHPATTVAQARQAILGATRKAATTATRQATTSKRRVGAKKGGIKRSVKAAAKKAKRKVAARKGQVRKAVKKAAKKARRR